MGITLVVETAAIQSKSACADGSPVHTVISKSYLNKQANSFSRKEWKLLKP
jgi:hypothetical protein